MKAVEGWKTSSLPLLLRLMKSGGTPNTSCSDYYGGQIPFVSIEDMTASSKHLTSTIKKLTDKGLKSSNAWIVPENSILYSIYATLGLPRINTIPVTTNQAILALINDPNKIDRDFLYYWFEYIRASVVNFSSQTTQSNLSATIVKSFLVDHPTDLSEQTKIAEVLSTVDRAIEQTEALIAKQQRIKTGLMQDLLTRGIDEHGNLRSEQTHEFKDSPLGRIPVEWEVKRLGNLLANINQGWSPDCDSGPASIGEWGVLKTTAVVWQGYSNDENKALPEHLKPRSSLEITNGNLLMTRAGPNSRVGVVAYVYQTRDKLMLSDKIYRLIPAENMDGRFLCYALSGFETQKHLSNYKTGMAESQTNISQEIVENLLTVVPNKGEQARIADRLDQMSTVTKRSVETLEKLRSLKTALMQDLLTGKKRVTTLLEASL